MPRGSAPGEHRGGRVKGTPNGDTAAKKQGFDDALKLAFAALGPEVIDTLSPAEYMRVAQREAAKAGFHQAALSIAKDVAVYFTGRPAPIQSNTEEDGSKKAAGYAVIPEPSETMDQWAEQAQSTLAAAPKSGDRKADPKPSC